MKEPRLTTALAERGDQPVLLISRNDSELFNRVDWELSTLAALGYLGACAHIGKVTLKMLQLAHPGVFAPYPVLAPEEPLATADEGMNYLLRASITDRTCAYLPALDALFERHADVLSQSLRDEWPYLRERILRDYPG